MSLTACCVKGFEWDGQPKGRVGKLAGLDTYIAGDNADAAVLLITDIFGWSFPNARLLADHYAREVGVTVFVPDFFHGEVIAPDALQTEWAKTGLGPFLQRHSREVRELEMFAAARALRREHKFKKLAAIGFCYGGWAVMRLAAAAKHQPAEAADVAPLAGPLLDAAIVAHPSLLVKSDFDQLATPLQVLAPENDFAYTAELKQHTFETVPKLGLAFDYHHFPGVEHGVIARGNPAVPIERDAFLRGKSAAVCWLAHYLKN